MIHPQSKADMTKEYIVPLSGVMTEKQFLSSMLFKTDVWYESTYARNFKTHILITNDIQRMMSWYEIRRKLFI